MGLAVPRKERLQGEFRKRLHPRQYRQSKSLGDEELRRFGRPCDHQGGAQNRRRRPQNRSRTRLPDSRFGKQRQKESWDEGGQGQKLMVQRTYAEPSPGGPAAHPGGYAAARL